jgi:hypothetical protein
MNDDEVNIKEEKLISTQEEDTLEEKHEEQETSCCPVFTIKFWSVK